MADKEMEDLKKQLTSVVKLHAQKTDKTCKDAKDLRDEQADLDAKKDPTDDDKKKVVDLRKALKNLEDSYNKQADDTSARINKLIKDAVPDDKSKIPDWQKGMDKWYRDMIDKEAGIDVGKDAKVTGEISIKDKKGMIYLKGKF
jgi:hypothetical protein